MEKEKKKKFSIKKIITICFFGLAVIFSAIFTSKVVINYNLSDYLDDSTQTKIALKINNDEFGPTGNIQVMVNNIDKDEAEKIYYLLDDIENVTNVNFDKNDTNYYKDNTAFYVVLIDGDDYSTNAKKVAENIKTTLSNYGEVSYAGTAIEKQNLQTTITNEMVYIMLVAVCLVAGILLLTSQSWIEPIILLLSCGVAILINRGTNIFFGNISYITNSISAILQLALSIDYSIVLLNQYRENKKLSSNNDEAMKKSIKEVIKPISASSLTTIAGLLALLFMSFHIGFDIGIVLMKGIVISVITSLTLLPILVLLFDKLLTKTKKKVVCPKGNFFNKFAIKGNKIIVPLAFILVCVCGYLQTKTPYTFSDSKAGNSQIIETFGENNSVVVLYKNQEDSSLKEQQLIEKVNQYKNSNDESILASYTSYSNTVEQEYNLKDISNKIEMDENQSSLLMNMYHLYSNPDQVKLTFSDFVNYTCSLTQTDLDVKEFVDKDIVNTLNTIIKVGDICNSDLTYNEFYTKINSIDQTDVSLFSIQQMYGLYFDDNQEVDFKTMLDFIIVCSQNENLANYFSKDTISQLQSLSNGINSFNTNMEQELTKTQLYGYMYQNYQVILTQEQLNQIYTNYYLSIDQEEKDTIPFLPLMEFLIKVNVITAEQAITTINQYSNLYTIIHSNYNYQSFLDALAKIAYGLTSQEVTIDITNESIQQIYIVYFREVENKEYGKINGKTFINYILETSKTNQVISSSLSNDNKAKLDDSLIIQSYLEDKNTYTYIQMYEKLNSLQKQITSTSFNSNLDVNKVSGPYIKYLEKENNSQIESIRACDLLDFIKANMDSNSLLVSKIDDSKREKINQASQDIVKANNLLKGENYSRMLLSVNLSNGGEQTTKFVEYLNQEVKNVFGQDAYITGEIVSTYDLKQSFSHDNLFITIFTIISIFIIVLLTFKSLSLPTLLVAIIQGAVFITMSTQLLSSGVFFMSYIVVTCILMGATIDYGILMSNNYIINRKTLDKKESLSKAIQASMPTIFTSGLILVICGFVISIISSQSSIATVGLLIGIGGICSIFMILFVLPSTLYLLDGFVMKLTLSKKINFHKLKHKIK